MLNWKIGLNPKCFIAPIIANWIGKRRMIEAISQKNWMQQMNHSNLMRAYISRSLFFSCFWGATQFERLEINTRIVVRKQRCSISQSTRTHTENNKMAQCDQCVLSNNRIDHDIACSVSMGLCPRCCCPRFSLNSSAVQDYRWNVACNACVCVLDTTFRRWHWTMWMVWSNQIPLLCKTRAGKFTNLMWRWNAGHSSLARHASRDMVAQLSPCANVVWSYVARVEDVTAETQWSILH